MLLHVELDGIFFLFPKTLILEQSKIENYG